MSGPDDHWNRRWLRRVVPAGLVDGREGSAIVGSTRVYTAVG